jgi:hypothetical protein
MATSTYRTTAATLLFDVRNNSGVSILRRAASCRARSGLVSGPKVEEDRSSHPLRGRERGGRRFGGDPGRAATMRSPRWSCTGHRRTASSEGGGRQQAGLAARSGPPHPRRADEGCGRFDNLGSRRAGATLRGCRACSGAEGSGNIRHARISVRAHPRGAVVSRGGLSPRLCGGFPVVRFGGTKVSSRSLAPRGKPRRASGAPVLQGIGRATDSPADQGPEVGWRASVANGEGARAHGDVWPAAAGGKRSGGWCIGEEVTCRRGHASKGAETR